MAKVKCRNCNWTGNVKLRKRYGFETGAASTGVPCPKCKQHKLRRYTRIKQMVIRNI